MPNPFATRFMLVATLSLVPWILSSQIVTARPSQFQEVSAESPYLQGIAAWRKAGFVDGSACASCHGPDGLELAVYDFSDATIKRRAAMHVGPEDADRIVSLIHLDREKYGIKRLRDPMNDRPLQPGGAVLPGDTPQARDAAFSEELQARLPSLTYGRIESLSQAVNAKNEILALDPWGLRIGIQMNRLSEDVFHGQQHASIAQWLPDLPRRATDAERATFFTVEDHYLADPSDENLWAMLLEVDKRSVLAPPTPAAQTAFDKFKSTLIAQHIERKRLLGLEIKPRPPVLFGSHSEPLLPNPMWDFGDLARQYAGGDLESLGFPQEIILKKSGGPSPDQQLKDIRLSWLWLGWLMDQGLQRISFDRKSQSGEYLCQTLWDDGPYPTHNAFFETKKIITESFVPEAWNSRSPQHFVLDYSGLLRNGKHILTEPKDPSARLRYRTFLANCFRMCMYLLLDEVSRTHVSWGKDANRGHVLSMAEFIDLADPAAKPGTEALVAKTVEAVEDASQRLR